MSEHDAPKGKPRLTRPQMAKRLSAEFQDGWIVNLGTGMPLMCSDFVVPDGRTVIFHAENGVIGYGRRAVTEDEASPHLVNAGGGAVVLEPFAAFIHHADSFAIVRKGMLNTSVLGAYEVGADGGLANWKVAGALGGGIGGAMDIAACAQQVFAILEHTQRNGAPRLLSKCTLPLTAPPCVTLVMTDLGLFRAAGNHFEALELAPEWTLEEVAALTGAPLTASASLGVVSV
jgi:3-oxoacid CoA-transferase B subunit